MAIPSKPDTEARGPGQNTASISFLKLLWYCKTWILAEIFVIIIDYSTFSSEVRKQVDRVCKKSQRVERHFILKGEHRLKEKFQIMMVIPLLFPTTMQICPIEEGLT